MFEPRTFCSHIGIDGRPGESSGGRVDSRSHCDGLDSFTVGVVCFADERLLSAGRVKMPGQTKNHFEDHLVARYSSSLLGGFRAFDPYLVRPYLTFRDIAVPQSLGYSTGAHIAVVCCAAAAGVCASVHYTKTYLAVAADSPMVIIDTFLSVMTPPTTPPPSLSMPANMMHP